MHKRKAWLAVYKPNSEDLSRRFIFKEIYNLYDAYELVQQSKNFSIYYKHFDQSPKSYDWPKSTSDFTYSQDPSISNLKLLSNLLERRSKVSNATRQVIL